MSSQPAARVVIGGPSARGHAGRARARRDSDAFLVTVLTLFATAVAFYDLLLMAAHAHG